MKHILHFTFLSNQCVALNGMSVQTGSWRGDAECNKYGWNRSYPETDFSLSATLWYRARAFWSCLIVSDCWCKCLGCVGCCAFCVVVKYLPRLARAINAILWALCVPNLRALGPNLRALGPNQLHFAIYGWLKCIGISLVICRAYLYGAPVQEGSVLPTSYGLRHCGRSSPSCGLFVPNLRALSAIS